MSPDLQSATVKGGCLCRNVRFIAAGPSRVHYCHCGMCRRATGSAFAVLAWVLASGLRWVGRMPPRHRRSSPLARRGFCPECGTPLTLIYDSSPEDVALHLGVFDRPEDHAPAYHYGVEGRLRWVDCGEGLREYCTEERW
jgi:hypothetical protein